MDDSLQLRHLSDDDVAWGKGPWGPGTSLLYEVSENDVNEKISVIRVPIFVIILLSTFLLFNSLSFASFFFSLTANYLFSIEDFFPGQP